MDTFPKRSFGRSKPFLFACGISLTGTLMIAVLHSVTDDFKRSVAVTQCTTDNCSICKALSTPP